MFCGLNHALHHAKKEKKYIEILTPDAYLELESLQIELIVCKGQDGFTEN